MLMMVALRDLYGLYKGCEAGAEMSKGRWTAVMGCGEKKSDVVSDCWGDDVIEPTLCDVSCRRRPWVKDNVLCAYCTQRRPHKDKCPPRVDMTLLPLDLGHNVFRITTTFFFCFL